MVIFSFMRVRRGEERILLRGGSGISCIMTCPEVLQAVYLFLFKINIVLFLCLSVVGVGCRKRLRGNLFIFTDFFVFIKFIKCVLVQV